MAVGPLVHSWTSQGPPSSYPFTLNLVFYIKQKVLHHLMNMLEALYLRNNITKVLVHSILTLEGDVS